MIRLAKCSCPAAAVLERFAARAGTRCESKQSWALMGGLHDGSSGRCLGRTGEMLERRRGDARGVAAKAWRRTRARVVDLPGSGLGSRGPVAGVGASRKSAPPDFLPPARLLSSSQPQEVCLLCCVVARYRATAFLSSRHQHQHQTQAPRRPAPAGCPPTPEARSAGSAAMVLTSLPPP